MLSRVTWVFILGLGACGFIRDNVSPSRLFRAEQGLGSNDGECPKFSSVRETNEISPFLHCWKDNVLKIFDKIHGKSTHKLNVEELRALLDVFVKETGERRIQAEEAEALILLKLMFLGGDPHSISRDEIVKLVDDLAKKSQGLSVFFDSIGRSADHLKALEDIFSGKIPNGYVSRSAWRGLVLWLQRKLDSSFAKNNLNGTFADIIYDFFSLSFGFNEDSRHQGQLSLRFLVQIPRYVYNWNRLSKLPRCSERSEDIECVVSLKKEHADYGKRLKELFFEMTAFDAKQPRAGLSRQGLADILKRIKNAKWILPDGKDLEIKYDPELLATRLLSFKSKLLGQGDLLMGASSFEALHDFIVRRHFHRFLTFPINTRAPFPTRLERALGLPNLGRFAERDGRQLQIDMLKDPIWMKQEDILKGLVPIRSLLDNYDGLSTLAAFASAFDDNKNGYLDFESGNSDDEVRVLVKTVASLLNIKDAVGDLAGGKKSKDPFSPLEKGPKLSADEEAKKGQESFINIANLVENDALMKSLIFFVDHFTGSKHSDGKVNFRELMALVQFVKRTERDLYWSERDLTYSEYKYGIPRGSVSFTRGEHPEVERRSSYIYRRILDTGLDSPHAKDPDWLNANIPALLLRDPKFLATPEGSKLNANWGTVVSLYDTNIASLSPVKIRERLYWFQEIWSDVVWSLMPRDDLNGTVGFTDLEKQFRPRAKASSFIFLPSKVQLVLLALPEEKTSDFFIRLIWNGQQVAQITRNLKDAANLDGWVSDILSLAPADENLRLSRSQLQGRALYLAQALYDLQAFLEKDSN